MLSEIEIRNYQSLHHVKLELDKFTVIVGPTSSGKSAFTRAMKMLTSNQRGDAFVTHGERTATITATTDKGIVSLSRGAVNEYTVIPVGHPEEQRSFTKLAGAVPEEVTAFLGIEPKDPLNYASQFDKPYLLDNSASEVARVLGALTNVNVILEAAREANRQRTSQNQQLKVRSSDLEEVQRRIQGYLPLREQLAALERADAAWEAALLIETKRDRLAAIIEQLQTAAAALRPAKEALAVTIPDIEIITAADQKLQSYRSAVEEMKDHSRSLAEAKEVLTTLTAEEAELHEQYSLTLGQLAGGIRDYYAGHSRTAETHPETRQPIIVVDEAAQLSADYIVEVLKP